MIGNSSTRTRCFVSHHILCSASYRVDSKVKIGTQFFYPDVMVVCDDKTDNPYYTESPILLVEVLSKSTRRPDETIKRVAYSSLPSVQE